MNRDGDQFDRAEIEDHLLDLADDHALRQADWHDLHDVPDLPTFEEWAAQVARIRKEASADPGHDLWWSRRG